MALKPCRECKKKVSTEALTCPNCGVPNPTQKKTTVKPRGKESNNTQDTNTKVLRSDNLYVQCEKSFCKDSYKIIANPAFVDQKCKCCGNILHEVSTKEGEKKCYIDNSKDFFAKRYMDDFFTNELNPTNHYARCETSSCNQKYDLVVNPIFVDQKCNTCGNILHKVSKKDAEKYIKDISPNSNKNKNDKRVNIQHGVKYCSNCGTELPSGPPCNNSRCRLAEISPVKKKKVDSDNVQRDRIDNKKLVIDENYVDKKREAAVKRIKEKHFGDNNSLTKVYGFWHGKGGLAKSFWLYFIVANMIGNFMLLGAATQSLSLVYLILVVIIIWNIFAIIGVFNAADIYKAKKIKSNESYGYATASKWAVVLLTMSGIGQALN